MQSKKDKNSSPKNTSSLCHFIQQDSGWHKNRLALWKQLQWTCELVDSHKACKLWKAKVAFTTRNYHRLGTASCLGKLNLTAKRLSKPKSSLTAYGTGSKEAPEWTLHKLRLYIRDLFWEKALHCIKLLSKDYLKANFKIVRRLFLECLIVASQTTTTSSTCNGEIQRQMENVAVALLERASWGLFEGALWGSGGGGKQGNLSVFPSFFQVAVALGRTKVVAQFLKWKKRAFLLSSSWQNVPVLHFGCFTGKTEIVKTLLDANADATLFCTLGDLEKLLALGNCFSSSASSHRRLFNDSLAGKPLYSFEVSAALGDLESVKLLINKIQRWNIISNSWFSFLLQQDLQLCICLLRAGVPLGNQRTRSGKNPLHLAVESGNMQLLAVFLRFGGRAAVGALEARDCEGNTPLHLAALAKERILFWYLLGKAAVCGQAQNCDGFTPLELAQQNGLEPPLAVDESEIEASAEELWQACPSSPQAANQSSKYPFNERLYRSIVNSFSSSASSRTCPSADASRTLTNEDSPSERANTRRCSTKFSLLNSFTAMFKRER